MNFPESVLLPPVTSRVRPGKWGRSVARGFNALDCQLQWTMEARMILPNWFETGSRRP